MNRKILPLIATILIIAGCNHTTKKTMPQETLVNTPTGKYANVNGLKMYYEIHGEGKPLVLIHGGGSTIQTTFGRILPLLAAHHKVIAVEMQAHGHTADIDRPLSFEQDADDIAELLKQLNIPKASIMGFSNGASTTLFFALKHAAMADKIIIASTFYNKSGAPQGFWDMMNKPSFETMPQVYKEAFLAINPDPNALRQMYERDVARMQSFPDLSADQIKSIKAPAFIMLGDKDMVTPEHATEMHRLLPNSRLAIIPGGHGDYLGEIMSAPDTVLYTATASMVHQFLNETKSN